MTVVSKVNAGPPSRASRDNRTAGYGQIVLVLQGGGALGAYQSGVYHALHEAGVEPDWVIGTSIGAINAALIVGNEPDNRLAALQEFWRRVTQAIGLAALMLWPQLRVRSVLLAGADSGISGFYKPNPLAFSRPTSCWARRRPATIQRRRSRRR